MKKSLIAVSCMGLMLSTGAAFGQGKGKGKGAPAAGNASKGKDLFEANCSVCHNSDSEERKMGPGLKGISKRPKLVNGEAMSDANLTKFVNEGGNGMPGFADLLTGAEKADVLAFLKSL
ncbi:MAG: cytochrome c [Acidobacteriota bacterium]